MGSWSRVLPQSSFAGAWSDVVVLLGKRQDGILDQVQDDVTEVTLRGGHWWCGCSEEILKQVQDDGRVWRGGGGVGGGGGVLLGERQDEILKQVQDDGRVWRGGGDVTGTYGGCDIAQGGVVGTEGRVNEKVADDFTSATFLWALSGMIRGPTDYESGALTN